MTEHLEAAAAEEAAPGNAILVSVHLDFLSQTDIGTIRVAVTRRTKTLLFLRAEYADETGARLAAASSVHKILG